MYHDGAGVQEQMYGNKDMNGGKLHLHFRLKSYPAEEFGTWAARKTRGLQAFHAQKFSVLEPTFEVKYHKNATSNLAKHLQSLKVAQVSFTKLA